VFTIPIPLVYIRAISIDETGTLRHGEHWRHAGGAGPDQPCGIPLLFWSSLQFLSVLIRTTNRLWHSPTYNWWRLPLKSLARLGITVSAELIGILLPGMARMFREWLGFSGWMFAMIFQLIPWLVLFYGLIMIYRVAPSRATRFSKSGLARWPRRS